MSFWNWILGKKENSQAVETMQPSHELFVETAPPAEEPAPDVRRKDRRANQRPAAVHDFLQQDFYQLGYNHALQFPVQERREAALNSLRSDYRQALQKAQQTVSSEKETHEQQVLSFTGVSHVMDAQLQRRTRELESLLAQLDQQMELSVDDEGWLAPALARYNEGFVVGAMQYARDNDLLGGITGLQ